MRRADAFLVLFLTLSCSLLMDIQAVGAAEEEPVAGVKAGDWMKYRCLYNFTTTNPDDLSSNRFEVYYMQIDVLSVMGHHVSRRYTIHYENGTEVSMIGTEDVRVFGYIIAANLSVGDPILHPKMDSRVNTTVTTDCLGVEREVNWVGPYSFNYSEQFHFFHWRWDRASGILVEAFNYGNLSTSDYVIIGLSRIWILNTNIWEIKVIPSDLDRDNYVGISDIIMCAEAFGSDSTLHAIRWHSYCDVDRDGRVGIKDLLIIAQHFGESA
ncbi:MAG: hypothetical protein JSV05_02670 [Candidatus Bathyarchaeota archaeon]|nr:MAG: hypothetical protein JSV05_02670 [Candidatus Bathyarchaeota archaeon]